MILRLQHGALNVFFYNIVSTIGVLLCVVEVVEIMMLTQNQMYFVTKAIACNYQF